MTSRANAYPPLAEVRKSLRINSRAAAYRGRGCRVRDLAPRAIQEPAVG